MMVINETQSIKFDPYVVSAFNLFKQSKKHIIINYGNMEYSDNKKIVHLIMNKLDFTHDNKYLRDDDKHHGFVIVNTNTTSEY